MLLQRRAIAGRQAHATPVTGRRMARASLQVVYAGAKVEEKEKKETKKKEEKEEVFDGPDVNPSAKEVQGLLNVLCNETEIAEMTLKMGGFSMKVRRSTAGLPSAAPAPVAAAAAAPAVAAAAPAYAAEASEPMSPAESIDESVMMVKSPKVGIFRRGQKGKALVEEKGQVKKGQALAYVEQLGTLAKIEAPQAGEVIKFLVPDGGAVEYGQEVVEMVPFFGGHIIGDSKYA